MVRERRSLLRSSAVAAIAAPVLLAACGTATRRGPPGAGWSCVPYARERAGIPLRGDAWMWWDAAAGRFERGGAPRNGSVLVLGRSPRLPQGHLAVVSRLVSAREIRVDHANWASGGAKGRVARDQPVLDVSAGNEWSSVRVWHPGTDALGVSAYPAQGFIHAAAVVAR